MDRAIGYNGPYTWVMLIPGRRRTCGCRRGSGWSRSSASPSSSRCSLPRLLKRRPRLRASACRCSPCWCSPTGGRGRSRRSRCRRRCPILRRWPAGRCWTCRPATIQTSQSQYRAIRGGWRTVNGYSGFLPPYYPIVVNGSRDNLVGILDAFQPLGELDVVVARDALRSAERDAPAAGRDDHRREQRVHAVPGAARGRSRRVTGARACRSRRCRRRVKRPR